MIVFGHNFLFVDEHMFQNAVSENDLETIRIVEHLDFGFDQRFKLKTTWFNASGQEVRYLSHVPFYQADKDFSWSFEIKDVVILIWDAESRKIMYIKGKNYTPERLRFWIFHTFFPIVLELERTYRILHVGSVEIEGRPVLFSAFSFGGKSTLTDYFIQRGHTMLSDDSLGIEKRGEEYYAIASYPFHRPYRELETLGHRIKYFITEPKPLHAVYLLEKSDSDVSVEIVKLKGIEKFKAFHHSNFINFDFMKQERFEFFSKMAKYIPVYKVTVPWDIKRLHEVYYEVCEHNGRLNSTL